MDNPILDRICDQLDSNSDKLEQLSKVVYENAAVVGILSKITLFIILAIVGQAIIFGFTSFKTKEMRTNINISQREKISIINELRDIKKQLGIQNIPKK